MHEQNIQPEGGQSGIVPPISTEPMGVAQDVSSPAMATPEQRQQLLDLIGVIRQKLGDFNAVQFAGKNKTEQVRRDLLRQVFEILQTAGVDLNDRESVAAFLEKLRSQNPQLAEWLESSMNILLGGENTGSATPKNPNEDMDLGLGMPNEYEYSNQPETPAQNIPQG